MRDTEQAARIFPMDAGIDPGRAAISAKSI
jgi:hypothetical protein